MHIQVLTFCITYIDMDYSGVPVPSILTLDVNHTRSCANINISDDNIVEGMEMFQVNFIETEGNQIQYFGSNITDVHIIDNESESLKGYLLA